MIEAVVAWTLCGAWVLWLEHRRRRRARQRVANLLRIAGLR